MANVYAVKTGNWSDTTVWNTGALPTSADDVFSNNFTVTIDQNVTVLSIRNTSATSITAGGGFTVSGNFTISVGTLVKSANLITYTGAGTLNLTTNTIVASFPGGGQYLTISGNGNVNWVGSITNFNAASNSAITKGGSGKLTITGNISVASMTNAAVIQINGGDFEITGDLTISNSGIAGGQNEIVRMSSTGQCIITGKLTNNSTVSNAVAPSCINSIVGCYIKHIGTMENASPNNGGFCISNTSFLGVHIFTGPFICNNYGTLPFYVPRLFYQITSNSYFEFRDSSTNGASSPSTPAPATRLVSPDTVVDAPAASNVRFGTTYALGTQTGTLRVPSHNSVAFGVLTDNTTGTAVLTPQAVWDYATSSLTTAGSIGERLKNVSTVDTTGDQLAALL